MKIPYQSMQWVFHALVCAYGLVTLSLITFMSQCVSDEAWLRYATRSEAFSLLAFVIVVIAVRPLALTVFRTKGTSVSSAATLGLGGQQQSVRESGRSWILRTKYRKSSIAVLSIVHVACLGVLLLNWVDVYIDLKYLVSHLRADQLIVQTIGSYLADIQVVLSMLTVVASGIVAIRKERA